MQNIYILSKISCCTINLYLINMKYRHICFIWRNHLLNECVSLACNNTQQPLFLVVVNVYKETCIGKTANNVASQWFAIFKRRWYIFINNVVVGDECIIVCILNDSTLFIYRARNITVCVILHSLVENFPLDCDTPVFSSTVKRSCSDFEITESRNMTDILCH